MKSKFKSEKNKKTNNIKQCIKENEKKDIKIVMMTVTLTFKYLFTYFNHMYLYVLVNIIQKLYNKIHPNNILFLTLFLRWIHYLVLCCYFSQVLLLFSNTWRDTLTLSQVSNCDGVVFKIYLDHKFQCPQEGLNCKSLAYEVVT